MAIVGVPLLTSDPEGRLSEHFGKAKFLGIYPDSGPPRAVRNTGLNGGFVAAVLAEAGCTDVLVRGIGGGALGHLRAAGIRAWRAPEGADVRSALAAHAAGELEAVLTSDHGGHGHGGHDHSGHGHGGCGCG